MPCSAFLIRTTATMSLKPRLRHCRHVALLRPSLLLSCFMNTNNALYHTHSVTGLLRWNSAQAADVVCMSSSRAAERSTDWKPARRRKDAAVPSWCHQRQQGYGRFAYQDASASEDSDREFGSSGQSSRREMTGATLENIDEWRWKLTMLVRNKDEQEVVSRERKDRRDFDHLAELARGMGLYSRQYSKVVVFSKVPQPNYRPDLDDRRPQREVVLPFGLHKDVDAHLRAHLSQKPMNRGNLSHNSMSRSNGNGSIAKNGGLYEQEEPLIQNSVAMERILQQRSLRLRNKQQEWQESVEGQKMLELRRSLPAYKEKDFLLKAVSENQVIVVSGETGCGKTTQLPQYILESEIEAGRGGVCSIICTQPRRISAMSVSERVAAERGENLGESVGYKVRLEGMKGRDTRLLFCTTGILLRRLLVDRKLKGVTHVIVDEIHERGMNEDFLLIILKELLLHRPELRLILMSATLNAELFSSYFNGAPMIHIPGFTYPVRAHFLENILEMTGYRLNQYNQIDDYGQDKTWKMQKQAQAFKKRKSQIASTVEDALEAADFRGYSPRTQESLSCWNPDSIGFNLIEHVLCHIVRKERPGAVLIFMTGWDDINSLKDQLQSHPLLGDPNRVLLLACHGSMPSAEQRLIFDKPEDGVRKIVLATNMAETSITINDVVFVIDCGKAKETSYDALNNTPCLLPSWISKAASRQRRGRAGRVQPGECYHLYPRCVYDAFADYQLPELLRTPLQSLCLQIKSLQLGSIAEFLSKALQSPEPLSVQNAVDYLKIIGALDENEDLTVLGRHLSTLPVEPKLGKMLILGAIFNCLDPIMTIVAGLSMRDPFMMPYDKKDLAESAKAQFAGRDSSDHLALIRAYDGWKNAERSQSGYEYCWRNFLSAQTLKAIDSLRKQFFFLLKDAGLVDNTENCNTLSHDEHLIRAIICAGLFPGICSVVNKEKSISLKTMEDGQVLLYSNSVNATVPKIPYPWLVFNEKVKVNSVFIRDSTGVSDSVLLLFGGNISRGGLDGHLKMLGGYLEFFMNPALANTYVSLKRELEELIHNKLLDPKSDMQSHNNLLAALRLLVSEDRCDGRFVYGRKMPVPSKKITKEIGPGTLRVRDNGNSGGNNSKSQLQTLLVRVGHEAPTYKTKQLKNNQFCSTVIFNGLNFVGEPRNSKKEAEKEAAAEAVLWLKGENHSSSRDIDHMSMLLKKSTKKIRRTTSLDIAKWS
ncbi:PREDICTED: ATP-dependent RNA helicase DHX36 [Fragaria vesca subsp. vesca]|uniref:ATP-dependent RNA helicase DHX36 n=1 Tax=Fragaria vesca subsp. vesca TaxID=101020 RepID=UPI0002C35CC8|nr:PREDICTED: ATP-dependent RNA helicase DHX36 [Fragaria vesca subsp. vesca]